MGKHSMYYGIYLKIDNTFPFIYYIDQCTSKSQFLEMNNVCKRYKKSFEEYIINPENQFIVESKADVSYFIVYLTCIIIAITAFALTINADDTKK